MSAPEPPSASVPGNVLVFLSYRRKDTAGHAGRLYDTLRARLDAPEIFMDIDAIEAGVDFVEVINEAVGKCDVLLALIGPDWLTMKNEAGERRIDEPGDFVRIEIEAALTRGVRVIPVLVDGGRMPPISQLPPSLATFGRRHALEISDARWGFDAGRLIESIEKIAQGKSDEAARLAAAAVATGDARVPEQTPPAAEDTPMPEGSPAATVGAAAAIGATVGAAGAEDEPLVAAKTEPVRATVVIDPDAPTGAWPIVGAPDMVAKPPPARRIGAASAARVAAALVIVVALGAGLFGSGLLGSGGNASPSPTAEARASLLVPSGVYVAVLGDTLATIAARFGVTTTALADANPGLSRSGVLAVGQIVVLPGVAGSQATTGSTSTPSALASASVLPSLMPSNTPPPKATAKATAKPTPRPTPRPTPKPTPKPTKKPTPKPNRRPVATAATWCPLFNDRNSTLDVLKPSLASDPDGNALHISSWGQPNNGAGSLTKTTYNGKDALLYNPASGFSGTAQFTLTIADSHEAKSTQIVDWVKVYSPIEQTGC